MSWLLECLGVWSVTPRMSNQSSKCKLLLHLTRVPCPEQYQLQCKKTAEESKPKINVNNYKVIASCSQESFIEISPLTFLQTYPRTV